MSWDLAPQRISILQDLRPERFLATGQNQPVDRTNSENSVTSGPRWHLHTTNHGRHSGACVPSLYNFLCFSAVSCWLFIGFMDQNRSKDPNRSKIPEDPEKIWKTRLHFWCLFWWFAERSESGSPADLSAAETLDAASKGLVDRSLEIPLFTKYIEIQGNIWKYTEIDGNRWKYIDRNLVHILEVPLNSIYSSIISHWHSKFGASRFHGHTRKSLLMRNHAILARSNFAMLENMFF